MPLHSTGMRLSAFAPRSQHSLQRMSAWRKQLLNNISHVVHEVLQCSGLACVHLCQDCTGRVYMQTQPRSTDERAPIAGFCSAPAASASHAVHAGQQLERQLLEKSVQIRRKHAQEAAAAAATIEAYNPYPVLVMGDQLPLPPGWQAGWRAAAEHSSSHLVPSAAPSHLAALVQHVHAGHAADAMAARHDIAHRWASMFAAAWS